jgi:uncharacterized protein YpmS
MFNFEMEDGMKKRVLNKWHLMLLLLVLNLMGFALAKAYFSSYSDVQKVHQEAQEATNLYGANVKDAATWAEFGIRIIKLFNSR